MKRPDARRHMSNWGLLGGTVTAMLYMLFLAGISDIPLGELIILSINPSVWLLALLFGGVPGLALGFVNGLVLANILKDIPIPFSRADMQAYRKRVYLTMALITSLVAIGLPVLFWGFEVLIWFWLIFLFPPMIASVVAAYAGHRYLFRLRLWSDWRYGQQKEKAKNTGHLEDKLKNEAVYSDEEAQEETARS